MLKREVGPARSVPNVRGIRHGFALAAFLPPVGLKLFEMQERVTLVVVPVIHPDMDGDIGLVPMTRAVWFFAARHSQQVLLVVFATGKHIFAVLCLWGPIGIWLFISICPRKRLLKPMHL